MKGKTSVAIYLLGIAASFAVPAVGFASYILVAAIWFVPDRRIERRLARLPAPASDHDGGHHHHHDHEV